MTLKDAAVVRSGLVLSRKQAKNTPAVRYRLLPLRAVSADGVIDQQELDVFDSAERLGREYITQAGDIVVRLSIPYTAVLIDETTEDMVISSNFIIIRTDRSKLLPEYLFWLLNTPKVRQDMYAHAGASMLGSIKTAYFSEFEVVPLPLQNQQIIGEYNRLSIREAQLLRELADERQKYNAYLLDKAQKNMRSK